MPFLGIVIFCNFFVLHEFPLGGLEFLVQIGRERLELLFCHVS